MIRQKRIISDTIVESKEAGKVKIKKGGGGRKWVEVSLFVRE